MPIFLGDILGKGSQCSWCTPYAFRLLKRGKDTGVRYAKERAIAEGCSVVRIDTYAYNEPAKALYQNHGFRIAGYADSLLEGVIPEKMVYLEWNVAESPK